MNVFDFDKTIYKRDSTADFYFYTLVRHPIILIELPITAFYFLRWKLGGCSKTKFKEAMYRFLGHIDDPEALAEKFWEDRSGDIKNWYLKMKKPDDLIISASPEFLLRPICRKLGVRLIASRVAPKTGHYTGLNCWGGEKVRRLKIEYPGFHINKFYSDSHSDEPLACLARKAFIVKGDKIKDWNFKK